METILRSFIKQRKQFLHANDQLHEGVGLSTKNIRSHRDHQAYGLVIEDEKDVLVGGYRKSPVTNLFGNIINIHPFEDGNGRTCRLILS